jgi:uncharacterized protein YjbI with pentapeptide repeats
VPEPGTATDLRERLQADCARCAGLCCVATGFERSAEFAFDKPAGLPCRHLTGDFRCSVHDALRTRGLAGCTAYDCFGAGQQVVQHTFAGVDWRARPEAADAMFAAFAVMRGLHELLWLLSEALGLVTAGPLREGLDRTRAGILELTGSDAATLARLDLDAPRDQAAALLRRAGDEARLAAGGLGRDLSGADLVGARLRGADLTRADLRGALLLGADLREADLTMADLTGADLRGADLGGADLAAAMFLSRHQVGGARGDTATRLPGALPRPAHWDRAATGRG